MEFFDGFIVGMGFASVILFIFAILAGLKD